MPTDKLLNAVHTASNHYFKLIIVAGPFQSGKTYLLKQIAKQLDHSYVNLNLVLTKRLLENKEDSYQTKSQELDELNSLLCSF